MSPASQGELVRINGESNRYQQRRFHLDRIYLPFQYHELHHHESANNLLALHFELSTSKYFFIRIFGAFTGYLFNPHGAESSSELKRSLKRTCKSFASALV